MDYPLAGALALITTASGVAGYCFARITADRTAATLGKALARLRVKLMAREEEIVRTRKNLQQYSWDLDLVREQRDDLFEAARARTLRLKEAGRRGALATNAKKAAQHKDAAGATIAALGVTPMRPREEVVADVAENRRRKLETGAGVAATAGG